MSMWYYVDQEKNDRIGPISKDEIDELIKKQRLGAESYVWVKGFDNWKQVKDVDELNHLLNFKEEENIESDNDDFEGPKFPPRNLKNEFAFKSLGNKSRCISIQIGPDRGGKMASEYGPYTLDELKRMYKEERVNPKTLVFTPGMANWIQLGEVEDFSEIFGATFQKLERREEARRPFVARMFFHDNERLYEGICRDISVGGMQILVSDFPVEVGGEISLNVHPDNSEYGFVASGQIVRKLEGGQGFSFRFTQIGPKAIEAIEAYLKHH